MVNSRAVNLHADTLFRKRSCKNANKAYYHDRVVEDHDFEIVHHREARLDSRKRPLETPRSPMESTS